jgi:hypothetical protein
MIQAAEHAGDGRQAHVAELDKQGHCQLPVSRKRLAPATVAFA